MKEWGLTPGGWDALDYNDKLQMLAHYTVKNKMKAYEDQLMAEEIKRRSRTRKKGGK